MDTATSRRGVQGRDDDLRPDRTGVSRIELGRAVGPGTCATDSRGDHPSGAPSTWSVWRHSGYGNLLDQGVGWRAPLGVGWRLVYPKAGRAAGERDVIGRYQTVAAALRQGRVVLVNPDGVVVASTSGPRLRSRR